jgi:hypothetical protein
LELLLLLLVLLMVSWGLPAGTRRQNICCWQMDVGGCQGKISKLSHWRTGDGGKLGALSLHA